MPFLKFPVPLLAMEAFRSQFFRLGLFYGAYLSNCHFDKRLLKRPSLPTTRTCYGGITVSMANEVCDYILAAHSGIEPVFRHASLALPLPSFNPSSVSLSLFRRSNRKNNRDIFSSRSCCLQIVARPGLEIVHRGKV